ncbi:amino acid adenylation domain-containing protein [Gordonia sp. CPCC 205515]|uniref:amino acid adenylation domain-containing protein n=1 Tax=Gordonia sp. CPCC 205515 TaxID=3140791 RepID=UPI003AF3AE6C
MKRASSAQQGLWFAQSISTPSPVFTVGQLLDFTGSTPESGPDPDRLLRAVQAALDEADGLRSRFRAGDRGDVFVEAGDPMIATFLDLGDDPRAIDAHARTAVDVVIDPAVDPCAAATVLRAGGRISLLVIAHHIVLDAYGLGLLDRRIGQLYADPDDDRGLRSVTTLADDFDAAPPHAAQFWSDYLAGVDGPLTLADRPRDHRIARSVHTVRTTLDGLGGVTRRPHQLVAALAAFCSASSGTDDVVLGFPLMNRLGSPAANVPCTTVNVVPLRVPVAPHHTTDQLGASVTEQMRAIAPHGRYRGEDIVRDLRRRGVDGATGPTINIKPFGASVPFGDLTAHVESLARGPVVDLSVTALGLDNGDLELLLDADAYLYDATRLDDIATDLTMFLGTALTEPSIPFGAIAHASTTELVAGIHTADRGTWVATDPTPIHERITAAPAAATAVICGDDALTYAELHRRATELSDQLGTCDAEDIVAVAMPRGIDLIVALLAVLRSGAAFLPLDPGFPADRIAATLADADPIAVIEPDIDGPSVRRLRPARPIRSLGPVRSVPSPDSPAYVIYTSGSTGVPKGVVIGHRALTNFTESMIREIGYRTGESLLAVTTISFDIAILETLVPLAAGMTVVLATPDDVHDPARLSALIDRHRVRVMQATPSLWSAVLDAGHAAALAQLDVLVGGEQLPPELGTRLARAARSVRNMYGPTETTIWSTTAPVHAGEPIHIGIPIDNTGVRVLDSRLAPLPVGQVGELYLTGDGLARGYRGRADLTATRFLADPYGADGARMYRTGDLARIAADGTLTCLGRTDHQVKVRGFRIELGDVETALAEHDSVDRAVASTVDGRLVGYVIGAAGQEIDAAALRGHVGGLLPDYMVPATVVAIDELPLTPNGKIDRKALPRPDFAALAGHSRAPATPAEQALARGFADVLGVPTVGADDDFFVLGGDSITAVRVVAAAAAAGWAVTPLQVFDHPTVARLAAVATAVTADAGSPTPAAAESTGLTTAGLAADEMDELMDGNLL